MSQLRAAAASSTDPRTLAPAAGFDPLALLLAETAGGRETSFARLYELTAGRLLAIARGIVGGRSDVAEEVVQESFLRVWRWAHQYDPAKGAAYAWLVRIVRNRALTAREQLHRREDGHDELDADTMESDAADPADHAMRSEEARRVNSCLANLPANHRRSLSLVYFEGLTHRELAERLGVQLGTAKSWVRRGLEQMNRCMTGGEALGWRELVAAEYAVGGLQGAVRLGFEKRRERDARYCRAVDRWEDRFALLTEVLAPAPVPAHVWKNIEQQIGRERVAFARPLVWQVASAVLALAVLGLLSVSLR
ncbi:MAG: sigma-70 family RNA polymerase sigma factor [Proteobacteria bacterium]|nr:sigma-70 family RNA polymerase sigma factor [Pseudomonadota bacterium]